MPEINSVRPETAGEFSERLQMFDLETAFIRGNAMTFVTTEPRNPYGRPSTSLMAWAFDLGRRERLFVEAERNKPQPSWKREVWNKRASS